MSEKFNAQLFEETLDDLGRALTAEEISGGKVDELYKMAHYNMILLEERYETIRGKPKLNIQKLILLRLMLLR